MYTLDSTLCMRGASAVQLLWVPSSRVESHTAREENERSAGQARLVSNWTVATGADRRSRAAGAMSSREGGAYMHAC